MDKKLVVITGASSGIGAALAQKFSAEGHPLLLLSRRLERMEALHLPQALCRKVDITDHEAFVKALAEAEETYGDIDLLINNAGQMLLGDLANQDPQEWRKMFDLNVLALMDGMQYVLPKMRKRRSGTIINIGSVAGLRPSPEHVAYTGAKFAVHSLTENARQESAAYNVRMITIAPGAVDTELVSHTTDAAIRAQYLKANEAMGGALQAIDIANAASYAYNQPQEVNIRQIVIAATQQRL